MRETEKWRQPDASVFIGGDLKDADMRIGGKTLAVRLAGHNPNGLSVPYQAAMFRQPENQTATETALYQAAFRQPETAVCYNADGWCKSPNMPLTGKVAGMAERLTQSSDKT